MNKNLITISKLNSSILFVDANPIILGELERYFQAKAENYRFNPKYKAGFWDGNIYHFPLHTQHLNIGLLNEVYNFARSRYEIKTDFNQEHLIEPKLFQKFVKTLDIIFKDRHGNIIDSTPRDYQYQSVYDALTKQHINIEVPTSGGKTLISYMIARYLIARGLKVIMIVPTTTLVEQSYGDWYDFGWDNVRDNVHKIYSGQEKWFGAPITISTWQSLYKDKEIFEQFDAVIIDEAHGAKATSLKNISNWCCNAEWRIGMSGTYPDNKNKEELSNYFNIVGALGPIKTYTSYKEMEDKGWIPKINIMAIILRYSQQRRKEIALLITNLKEEEQALKAQGLKAPSSYNDEIDYIHNIPERNEFIINLVKKSCKGNTMILFTKKGKHGIPLKDELEKEFRNTKKVVYIDGDISTEERNMMRKKIDVEDDMILIASYGTFSTGISIKNIHNIIFASSYKSKIKILQSIGRGLRKMEGKEKITIYDLVDDCSLRMKNYPKYSNTGLKQFKEREKIYNEKGLNWKSIKYKF